MPPSAEIYSNYVRPAGGDNISSAIKVSAATAAGASIHHNIIEQAGEDPTSGTNYGLHIGIGIDAATLCNVVNNTIIGIRGPGVSLRNSATLNYFANNLISGCNRHCLHIETGAAINFNVAGNVYEDWSNGGAMLVGTGFAFSTTPSTYDTNAAGGNEYGTIAAWQGGHRLSHAPG